MSVPVALPSAILYGVADFTGGIAARRAPVLVVTAITQLAGLVVLVPAMLLAAGTPSVPAFVLGGAGAVVGTSGLLLYLRGLAVGPMGVVAPLSAVVGAGLPLVVGMVDGERPGPVAFLAIGVALVAILQATAGTSSGSGARGGLLLGLGAGVGFGMYFVALDATPADSGLWPLLSGRLLSSVLLILILAVRGTGVARGGLRTLPVRLMVLSGISDVTANLLFLIAARSGDLGVTAVLVSLYPVVVVLLARVVLHEKLSALQLTSAGLALGASVLLAAAG
jgi:uncharacterized membrane protein